MSQIINQNDEEIYFEKNAILSKSVLWELQKKAYCQFGPAAWQAKNVPFYLTSNPLIARHYAQIVVGFFRDCLTLRQSLSIDLKKPFYILDLGAGTGRFAYLFLNELFEMLANLKMPFRICYVMTDIVEANIEFWKKHSYFKSFLKEGFLDFAYYDHTDKKNGLDLVYSGNKLTADVLRNPLLVIANYFFDTIPHDIFCVKGHVLYEGRISLSYKKTKESKILSTTDPSIIPHIIHHVEYFPVESTEPFDIEDPEYSKILKSYAQEYENVPYFLFPVGAFQVIRFLRGLSNDRMLFLTGDQGITSDKQLLEDIPFFAKHDSFSISVNYHAIQAYYKQTKGFCLLTSSSDHKMVHMAAVSCFGKTEFPELREAFRLTLATFEPQDYFKIVETAFNEWKDSNLEFMIKLIKLGVWDPINFNLFFSRIREKLPSASEKEREELITAIHQCWKKFFPIHKDEGAFVINLGVLLYEMKQYDEAIQYFQYALNLGYEEPLVFKNISLAYQAKKDPERAKIWYDKGLELHLQNIHQSNASA